MNWTEVCDLVRYVVTLTMHSDWCMSWLVIRPCLVAISCDDVIEHSPVFHFAWLANDHMFYSPVLSHSVGFRYHGN